MHVLNHKGKYLSVRRPLNIAARWQGWPVIVQAGASEDGKQLAAETAEAVSTGGGSLSDGKALCRHQGPDGQARAATRASENPAGAFVVVGNSVEEAKEKRALLDSKVHYDSAIASLSVILAPMLSASIPTQLLTSPKPMPPKAAGSGWWTSPPATS